MSTPLLFSLLLTSLLLSSSPFAGAAAADICHAPDDLGSSTLRLINADGPCSPFRPKTPLSWADSILQVQSNDKARLTYLSSLATTSGRKIIVPIASGRQVTQSPTYIVRAKIGTPPQTILMSIDTSNDAAWIPCAGCVGCSAVSPAYNPSKSITSKPVACGAPQCSQVPRPSCGGASCGFNTTYGGSTIVATLVQDNITLALDSVNGYTFGCINKATGASVPAQGMLGLGRGPLSLLGQTPNLYRSTFSYCLPSYKSAKFSGSLRLGTNSQPLKIGTTPLLKNPARSTLYYVSMTGIRVGKRVVKIPPSALAFNPSTGAGTIFDSGTVYSILVAPAYTAVRDEFRRQMGNATVSSLGGFDTCYTVPVTVPTVKFMFSGLNMSLGPDNFIIRSTAGSTSCLAMAAAPAAGVNSMLNVIATYQQQNFRVLVDVPNSKLGVARESCS